MKEPAVLVGQGGGDQVAKEPVAPERLKVEIHQDIEDAICLGVARELLAHERLKVLPELRTGRQRRCVVRDQVTLEPLKVMLLSLRRKTRGSQRAGRAGAIEKTMLQIVCECLFVAKEPVALERLKAEEPTQACLLHDDVTTDRLALERLKDPDYLPPVSAIDWRHTRVGRAGAIERFSSGSAWQRSRAATKDGVAPERLKVVGAAIARRRKSRR